MAEYRRLNGVHGMLHELNAGGFTPKRILDIGANVGQSIMLFRSVWPEAHVTSIEANEICRDQLEMLADELHIAVLSDTQKEVTWWTNEVNPISQGCSYYQETLTEFPHTISETRQTTTLEALLGNQQFDIIKLDTQGSELDIIRGGPGIVQQAQFIICEMQVANTNKGAPMRAEVEAELSSLGFGDGVKLQWWIDSQSDKVVDEDWMYRKL